MSIASEITSIGENLKKDYQSIANLGADLTNVDKNIENIAELLDGVYDNLPKTEYQEGTEVTLSNTLKGKLDYDNGVVGIGQSSQASTQGYQLINPSQLPLTIDGVTLSKDTKGNIVLNGTPSISEGYINFKYSAYINLSPNTYTLSVANKKVGIGIIVSSSEFGGALNLTFADTSKSKSKAISNNTSTDVQVNVRYDVGTLNNFILNPMLEEGSTAHDWEEYTGGQASPNPSYPQTINSVTGNQDVVVSGKNKFGLEKRVYTPQATQDVTASINNGKLTASGTSNAHTSYSMSVVTGEKYTIIWKNATGLNSVQVKDGQDGTQYFRNYNTTGLEVITTRTDTLFLNILSSGTTLTIEDVMVVKGEYTSSTIGNYEPYITPTSYQLSLGDIELNAIGNYKDELVYDVDEDKVYKNEKIGKYTFTGNENIALATSVGNMYAFRYDDLSNNYIGRDENQYLCTNYKQKLVADWDNEGIINVSTSVPYIYIFTTGDTASNVTAFKTWLANNKPLLYYRLETPTLTEITDTTLINQVKALYNAHSNNGTTIITSNGNLPMIIKVRGLKGE